MTHEMIHLNTFFPFLGEAGCDPTVTLYLPRNLTEMKREEQKRPTILICPGGGYHDVSQREAEPIALHFLPEGYNVAVLFYSVPGYRFPTQLREVAAAMELLYAKADDWHVDTQRIAIMGFSAGGHLAAHYSTDFDCAEVREVFPESKAVNASVLCYPVITAEEGKCHPGSFKNLVGHHPLTGEENKKFSLERRVTETTPPTFLWHTAADTVVPVVNSLLYAQALAEHGVPFGLHIYPRGFHGLATVDGQTNGELSEATRMAADWLPAVKVWLRNTL